uniref:Uncharacterized protein n=1 Tax=Arundo donax TaxID=35708 RepID=A0A0A8ZNY6_ARUDO
MGLLRKNMFLDQWIRVQRRQHPQKNLISLCLTCPAKNTSRVRQKWA